MTQPLGPGTPRSARKAAIEVTASRHFLQWLEGAGASLALTTYHSNRLFLIGVKDGDRLSVFQRVYERAMGLAATPEELLLATRFQLWRFVNVLRPGEVDGDCDRYYKPHLAWTTGDLDIHDVAFDAEGAPVFVSTLFGCLATVDERHSFRPLWRPPFLSRLVPEDRCHLNGMAMESGRPRYVTAASRSDVASGWRDKRHDGGVVVDVESGEIVLAGLSMPHSPRLHDGRLWVLNSGTGELGVVDLARGAFEPVCFCPGYLRGLVFHRGFALVGMSKCREERTFSGLELDQRLGAKQAEAKCGLAVVELQTGSLVHWLEFSGEMRELYDVQVLAGVRCPRAYGLQSKDIWGVATHQEDGRFVRHSGVVRD
jgi:uncharacterized protein (TIGR03032 family)